MSFSIFGTPPRNHPSRSSDGTSMRSSFSSSTSRPSATAYGSSSRFVPSRKVKLRSINEYDRCQCGRTFGWTVRKNNCFYCGEVFCSSCVQNSRSIPHLGYLQPVLVCRQCDLLLSIASMRKEVLRNVPLKCLLFYLKAYRIRQDRTLEKEDVVKLIEQTLIIPEQELYYREQCTVSYDFKRSDIVPRVIRWRPRNYGMSEEPATQTREPPGTPHSFEEGTEFMNGFLPFSFPLRSFEDYFVNPLQNMMNANAPFERFSDDNPPSRNEMRNPSPSSGQNSQRNNQRSNRSSSTDSRPPSNPIPTNVPVPALTIDEIVRSQIAIERLSVSMLKRILEANCVEHRHFIEKDDLVKNVKRLCEAHQNELDNRSMHAPSFHSTQNASSSTTMKDDDLCKICFDKMINSVILECGHMVTCLECGKKLKECPICRENITRIVHIFKV